MKIKLNILVKKKFLLLYILILFVVCICGCRSITNNINYQNQNIKDLNLEVEWKKIVTSSGREIYDPYLNQVHILTNSKGYITLLSWQWIETNPTNGLKIMYLTQKRNGYYKIVKGTDFIQNSLKLIPVNTMVKVVDKYGINKIFNQDKSADLILFPTITSKFSLEDAEHLFIQNGNEIDPNTLKSNSIYINGIFGQEGNTNREYIFSLEN